MKDDQGTLVSVSLDQLRAFDLNPRITRNPNYDEIKESIRHRGLEHPPQITRRPGEAFYIIANGGNTRLAILNDLWLETHDKNTGILSVTIENGGQIKVLRKAIFSV
ncbi:hypothetical protein BH012_21810 [Salmonella enterica]|nr:hypothetical protein [Salmonella enterica]EAX6603915.1 hypothetical protein [Salmonella enterica]